MNVIILVDNKPTEVSDDACKEIMRLRSENAALRKESEKWRLMFIERDNMYLTALRDISAARSEGRKLAQAEIHASKNAYKSEGKTYAERFGTPSHPNGCPALIAVALEKAESENAALKIGCAMLGIPLEDIEKASANSLAKRIAFRMEKETQP